MIISSANIRIPSWTNPYFMVHVTMVGFVSFCSFVEDWSRLWISGNFDSATPRRASTWKSYDTTWRDRWRGGHPIRSKGNDDRLGPRGSGLRGWNLMQTYEGMILLRDLSSWNIVHWVGCHIKWPLFSYRNLFQGNWRVSYLHYPYGWVWCLFIGSDMKNPTRRSEKNDW